MPEFACKSKGALLDVFRFSIHRMHITSCPPFYTARRPSKKAESIAIWRRFKKINVIRTRMSTYLLPDNSQQHEHFQLALCIVSAALRRPVTIIVGIVTVVLCAVVALRRMPRDILPTLGIPVIYVAQPFGGLDPAQMEGYLTYYSRFPLLYITGIEHVESKSIQGVALIKLQFYPGTDMAQALAETVNYSKSRPRVYATRHRSAICDAV